MKRFVQKLKLQYNKLSSSSKKMSAPDCSYTVLSCHSDSYNLRFEFVFLLWLGGIQIQL